MKKLLLVCLFMFHHAAIAADDHETLVMQAYATFGNGDAEGWAALHTEDLVFTIFGDLPHSGVHEGTDAVINDVFAVIPRYWPDFALEPINVYAIEDKVFVHNRQHSRGIHSETMHMFEIRDGKIARFTAFDDTDALSRSMIVPAE
jgi:ketosteroid isomerase-like protein